MAFDASSKAGTPARLRYSVRGLANWVLDYADELGLNITNMALNKLVFFAFEQILLRQRAIITEAKIEAWEHGPVFREIYHDFKRFGDKPITKRSDFYSVDTGKVEIASLAMEKSIEDFLRSALKPLIHLSAARLREISHEAGSAWHRVWCYDGHANPGMEITPQTILEAADAKGRGDDKA